MKKLADYGLDDHPDDDPEAGRGGPWLTYRYRFASGVGPQATGTIKAPSFLAAARRLVRERLAERIGAGPAFLRLRAAGEEEVLLEIAPPAASAAARPVLTVVPADRFRFLPDADDPA